MLAAVKASSPVKLCDDPARKLPSGAGPQPLRSPARSRVCDHYRDAIALGPWALANAMAIWRTRSIATVSLGTTKASNALSQTFAQPNLPTLAL